MAYSLVEFDKQRVELRRRLERHALGPSFTGHSIKLDGRIVEDDAIEIRETSVTARMFAHLFLLANGSDCRLEVEPEMTADGAPPGQYISSVHEWVDTPNHHRNRVGIYKVDAQGEVAAYEGVFIDHVFYKEVDAPAQLGTVSFSFLALAAYDVGFAEIALLAGGGAGSNAQLWGIRNMVGYKVWPKFGFDAPLEAGETAHIEALAYCTTVSEVRRIDLTWWEGVGGNGRVMKFDLAPESASWQTLLEYALSKTP
jgi:hypothetical protein